MFCLGSRGRAWFPQSERQRWARGAVVRDGGDVEPRERASVPGRVGCCRRGEHERRLGPVAGRDTPQPSQHAGRVRPEDTSVDVAFVDDDESQRAPEH